MTLALAGVPQTPLHRLEEAWRARGQRPPRTGEMVAEPCLCGDVIRAANKPHLIEAAVLTHNNTPRHTRWAVSSGWREG